MESSAAAAPHVVVIPFAFQGHINPLLQLSRALASHGCFVTFLLSQNTLPSLASPFPNLHFQGIPDLLPPERSKGSDCLDSVQSMLNMQEPVRHLLHSFHVLAQHPVSLLVYDAFILWSPALASQFSIPSLLFFTSNANCCCLTSPLLSLLDQGVLPFPRDDKNRLPTQAVHMPGLPPLLPDDFPSLLTQADASDPMFRFAIDAVDCVKNAPAIVINTFEKLERTAMASLRREKQVYAVGPLLLLSGSPTRLEVNFWPEQDDCLPWLDTQEPSSVLYISFGSVASLPTPQMKELARGLEASQQPFLWVIRRDCIQGSLAEVLPQGFLSRTKDRGFVISWAPQLLVLAHRAVGGFLTQGGWNSILENLSTGGVPMICWPLFAEQRLNCRLLVDHWKVGMEFGKTEDGFVEKEEVEKVVRYVMQGEEGKHLRSTATNLRDMSCLAVADGGSSHRDFKALMEHIKTPFQAH